MSVVQHAPLQVTALDLRGKAAKSPEDLREIARKFEASLLTPMVEDMLKTAGSATFGAGNAEEVWRSFTAQAIAAEIAETDSTGIADSIARQLAAYSA